MNETEKPRFIDNGNDSITDNATGLMWQKDTRNHKFNFAEAKEYAATLSLAGFSDWRVPTIQELQSIVDYTNYFLAIYPMFNCFSSFYWSSTTNANYTSYAWYVNFYNGNVYSNYKAGSYYVRCVRDISKLCEDCYHLVK